MPDPEFGGETGSTRVVKADFLLGMVPPISGHIVVANDNYAGELRAAA
jgi:ABC-type antimicrobial peptide transport system ATPase subunit